MSAPVLTEWRSNPGTARLVNYLRQRRAHTVRTFLAGQPVDQVDQGRAAALHELEILLTSPADEIERVFTVAEKASK